MYCRESCAARLEVFELHHLRGFRLDPQTELGLPLDACDECPGQESALRLPCRQTSGARW
jgi:hypothetical protein